MSTSVDTVEGKIPFQKATKPTQEVCTACKLEKKLIPAEGFCSTCDEYLCEVCYKYHIRLLVSRDHAVQHKDDIPKADTQSDSGDEFEAVCEYHQSKRIEFYCKTCDKVGCLVCVPRNHKYCKIVYIPEYTREIEIGENRKAIELDNNYIHEIEYAETLVSRCKWKLELSAQNAREPLELYRKEINETIDRLEHEMERQISIKKQKYFGTLDGYLELFSDQRKQMQTFRSNVHKNSLSTARNKKFVSAKLFSQTFQKFEKCKEELKIELPKQTFDFETVRDLKADLRRIIQRPEKGTGKVRSVKLEQVGHVDIKQNMETYKGSGTSLEKCYISACVALPDERILLNDSENSQILLCKIHVPTTQSNGSIIEGNLEMDIICLKSLNANPWDLSMIDDKEVVVTLPSRKQIQFMKLTNTDIELNTRLCVGGECQGIAHMDNKLYISFRWPGKVEIMDRKGGILGSVSCNFSENFPQFKFSEPRYIECDVIKKLVYISEFDKDFIAVTDVNGEIKYVVQFPADNLDRYDKWLRKPLAMCAGMDGSVFVAADWPYSVQRIHPDFLNKDVLIHRGRAWGIRALACYNNKLYFGTNAGLLYVNKIINKN